jgi:hypothetical protein
MVTPEQSIPTKSAAYLYAQSAFFTQFNEIDFYVEDTNQESLYECVLSRLFPKITVEQIFPLGSKTAVLTHAANNATGRKTVYLLDKDFDDLLGATVNLPTIVYLERYSIENYVLEPTAIRRFIVSERPTETIASVQRKFDVVTFLSDSITSLRSLFLDFFLVQKYALGLPNTHMSPAQFTATSDKWLIDNIKVRAYEKKVLASKPGLINLTREAKRYNSAFELSRRSRFVGSNISGKYLLALVLRRVTNLFKVPGTDASSATFRLAEYCQFASLKPVQEKIARSLRLPGQSPQARRPTTSRASSNRRRRRR